MTSWLLGIVGVVFLGVLFDLIFPNGKLNSLCRNIFGIFALFVIISPILKVDVNDMFSFDSNSDSQLISNINDAKNNSLILKIEEYLKTCGFEGVAVEIDSNLNYEEYVIKNIYVDITNLVLTENIENINKYEVIAEKVNKITGIDLERIVVYG